MRRLRPGFWASLFLLGACNGAQLPNLPTNDPIAAAYCNDGYVFVPAIGPNGSGNTSPTNTTTSAVNPNGICIPAEELLVHGVVTDNATLLPAPNVSVDVYPLGQLAKDANGIPFIKDPNGYVSLKTDANGYFKARGVLTTDNVIVVYSSPNFVFTTKSVGNVAAGPGGVVIDASQSLIPMPYTWKVAGTVYAGDAPAVGAIVQLMDSSNRIRYATTTDASGRYTFASVFDSTGNNMSFQVRVMPYDKDGDGILDYMTTFFNLATLQAQTQSLTNIAIPLVQVTRNIVYMNLLNNSGTSVGNVGAPPISSNNTVTGTGGNPLRLNSPTSKILIQFSSSVQTSVAQVTLFPWENGSLGTVFGTPLATTQTWSPDHSLLTITPVAPLAVDSDINTAYVLRLRSILWTDGGVFVSDSTPNAFLDFRFDVGTVTPWLPSTTPSLYVGNLQDSVQVVTQAKCDSAVCWLLDSAGYWNNGYINANQGTTPSALQYWNKQAGLQLTWPAVNGAKNYTVYARERNTNNTSHDKSLWYAANAVLASQPVDPSLGAVVYATGVLGATGSGKSWNDFGFGGTLGALAMGGMIDIAVTATDYNGFESLIDASKLLTLADTTVAALDTADADANGGATQASSVETGSSKIHKVFKLTFSEFMNATRSPLITTVGGNIQSFNGASTLPVSWDASGDPLRPENTSTAAFVGPVTMAVRGACSPITCSADANTLTTPADTRICVKDASLFAASNKVFFINDAGTLLNTGAASTTTVTVGTSNTTTNIITFTPGVQQSLAPGGANVIFACVGQAVANNVASLTVAGTTTNGILTVNDAKLFYVGEPVTILDATTTTTTLVNDTISYVDTVANKITVASTPGVVYPLGTVVMRRPTSAEYAYRTVGAPTMVLDANTTSATVLTFDASLSVANKVMVGDLVQIDLDGSQRTVSDIYYATVTAVVMDSVTPAYTLTLGAAPEGLTTLPAGLILRHSTAGSTPPQPPAALILTLGDSFQVSGATSNGLVDTSGNQGVNPYRDQFSACSGTPGCTSGYYYY